MVKAEFLPEFICIYAGDPSRDPPFLNSNRASPSHSTLLPSHFSELPAAETILERLEVVFSILDFVCGANEGVGEPVLHYRIL